VVRTIADQVVVLTGASSGIGRQTAIEFARRGARLVLAARSAEALDTLATDVERLGSRALVAPTDVSDVGRVSELAAKAAQHFGRIDTWVNNAGVTIYGTVEQTDVQEIRRVIEVNLLGQIHGMKAALPYLRETDGTIVNVSSYLARRAVGLQAPYCAAAHGVAAFSEALRLELRHDQVPVHIVEVLPSPTNTPLFEHARSKIGVLPRPIPFIYEPGVVADAIVAVARKPVRQVYVGSAARMLETAQRLSPSLVDWYLLGLAHAVDSQKTGRPDDGRDNLDEPSQGPGRSTGQFGRWSRSTSHYTRVFGLHPRRGRIASGVALGAALATVRWLGRRR
jgi:short-subunit dehydrogenase